ncbi:hypothetical protein VQ643_00085 [Pseudomonas sp. F1_0610]|uniref:hypothetical protein n=1 Tax=Pseudomonas sp. F1_0610 TaxID=3114284 RepID=UPI0039C2349A
MPKAIKHMLSLSEAKLNAFAQALPTSNKAHEGYEAIFYLAQAIEHLDQRLKALEQLHGLEREEPFFS